MQMVRNEPPSPGAPLRVPRARRRRGRPGNVLRIALVLVLGTMLLAGGTRIQAGEAWEDLDQANLERTDAFGLSWDPQPDGMLRDGSNDCFDGGLELKLNQTAFSPNQARKMSRDGSELLLQGQLEGLEVSRRVFFDLTRGAARYIEILHNPSTEKVSAAVAVTSALGGPAHAVVTNTGDPMAGGMLGRAEYGVLAHQQGGTRPGVLFVLSTPGSPIDPTIEIEGKRRFVFTWNVTVPPGKRVALLHTVAQRRYAALPAGGSLEQEFAPFLQRDWLAGLPSDLSADLANFRATDTTASIAARGALANQEYLAVVEMYRVVDHEGARLFVEPDAPLAGTVAGGDVTIETAFGSATLPLSEVCLLRGGANAGRSMRTYLRNGEILCGEVRAPGLTFTSPTELSFPIDPAAIDALFLPIEEGDGVAPGDTDAFLQDVDGTKLALLETADAALPVASAWGDLAIPLERLHSLASVREPRSGFRLELDEGTRIPVSIVGTRVAIRSVRFGEIEIEPQRIALWHRHGVAPVMLSKYHEATGPTRTHVALQGGSVLVGRVEGDSLPMRTGPTTSDLPLDRLHHLERVEEPASDGAEDDFLWYLVTGRKAHARLGEPLLPFRTAYGRCWIPVEHIVGYRIGNDPAVQAGGSRDKAPGEGDGPPAAVVPDERVDGDGRAGGDR